MINSVRETIAHYQDKTYGGVIISKPPKTVLWYWTRYLIIISVIPLIIGIFVFTRYLPESPKFIRDRFPEGKITLKNKQLSTTLKEPFRLGSQDFMVIIDTNGNSGELDSAVSGVLFLKDKAIIKPQDSKPETQDYAKIPDFSIDKTQLSTWVSQNLLKLWWAGLAVILVIGIISFCLSWIFRLLIYGLWALAFWIFGKSLLKKTFTYLQSFSIVLYASVIQLILSLFLAVFPNQILEALGTVLFVYFSYSWIRNLPESVTPVVSPPFRVLPEIKPPHKPRSRKVS